MKPIKMRPVVWDIEADGLLDEITKIHCLVIGDPKTDEIILSCAHNQAGFSPIQEGIDYLLQEDVIPVAHFGNAYDIPALKKVRGVDVARGRENGKGYVDTVILTRTIMPDTSEWDFRLMEKKRLPGNLKKSHKLEAWGYRLGVHKGDYAKGKTTEEAWANWSPEMQAYCEDDVRVNMALYRWCLEQDPPEAAVVREHQIDELCRQTEANGFKLDRVSAESLLQDLQTRKAGCEDIIAKYCGKIWIRKQGPKTYTPSLNIAPATAKKHGYTPGCPLTKVECVEANPRSRDHIIKVLMNKYNWKPTAYTKTGKAQLKEEHIESIQQIDPEFKTALIHLLKIEKIMGYVWTRPEGKRKLKGWLQITDEADFVHGYTIACGCVTGRPAYSSPNMGQVPKVKKSPDKAILKGIDGGFGWDCRSVWTAPKGKVLIGSDLSGLELRMLGHFLYPYDKGEYADIVLNGDIHSVNQELAGLSTRDTAKTFIYAWLYGAGDWLIGSFDPPKTKDEARELVLSAPKWLQTATIRKLTKEFGRRANAWEVSISLKGRQIKENFFNRLPALAALKADVITKSKGYKVSKHHPTAAEQSDVRYITQRRFDKKTSSWSDSSFKKKRFIYTEESGRWWEDTGDGGFINGLDGRKVMVRSEHSALNFLLQGGGALVCKEWLLQTDKILMGRLGWSNSLKGDYARHVWVHDEQNLSTTGDRASVVKQACINAAPITGKLFNLKVPIAAEAEVGQTWAEVH